MDMKKITTTVFAALAVLLASCSDALQPVGPGMEGLEGEAAQEFSVAARKMIGRPSDTPQARSFLVKLDAATAESVSSLMAVEGVEDVQPLFHSTKGSEELERRFGLDRWFEVTMSEGAALETVSRDVAMVDRVSFVEFDRPVAKAFDGEVIPFYGTSAPASATKAVASGTFNDPNLPLQWNFKNTGDKSIHPDAFAGADINVTDVWQNLCTGDSEIIVAVIDEGIKYTHPDLKAHMWTNTAELNGTEGVDDDGNGYVDDIYGYNFVPRNGGPISWGKSGDTGHGCHCGGVISAVNNNGVGISSVAGGSGKGDGVRLMSCQLFDGESGGASSSTAKAFKYAADHGASVASCSWGYKAGAFANDDEYIRNYSVEVDAIRYFEAHANNPVLDGNIAIFSAGNDGTAAANFPGALNDLISVSSFGPDFLPASYTNYGPGCNIVAPGGQKSGQNAQGMILSCVTSEISGSDYGYMQGTSMACPHVSGIAALALSYAKSLGKTFTLKEFKTLLTTSANDLDTRINQAGSAKYLKMMGTGAIDTWLLMMQIEGIPSIVTQRGKLLPVDISSYFGSASINLTYLGVEVSDEGRQSLGLKSDPYIKYGKLFIEPTKVGSARIRVKAIAGGSKIGGSECIGGMEVSHEISIISRDIVSGNGGWF